MGLGRSSQAIASMDYVRLMLDAAMLGDADTVRKLLRIDPRLANAGGSVPADGSPYTALYLACENGHPEIVQLLVSQGADLDAASSENAWSPLAIAIAYGHDDIVDALLDRGAYVDIFAAAALGDIERLRELVAAAPHLVAATGPDGGQPLHFAGSVEAARLLIDHGADAHALDEVHQNTPARWAAADSRRQAVARYLARFDTETDLFMACAGGDAARVQELLAAHPSLLNVRGRPRDLLGSGTPLHLAAERGRVEVAQALLELGADPNARSAWGHYPLHAAVMRGHGAVVDLLLAYGARPDVRDRSYNATPQEWAMRFGKRGLAERLAREPGAS